jgi:uncharacterized protein with HEPN domain
MRPEVAKRLVDAHAACVAVASFTAAQTFASFSASALVRSAVERQFEIIGESLGRAARDEPGIEMAVPELPRIVGLRNRLIHGYDSVDDEILWDLVQNKISPLRSTLEALLAEGGWTVTGR